MHLAKFFREWLLRISIVLVTIPGIRNWELSLFGQRLGRLQPFKFAFMLWLIAQLAWVISRRPWKRLGPISAWGAVLAGSVLLLDAMLTVGIVIEGGGLRGKSIYGALLLGQLAALLSILDEEFSLKAMVQGFLGAVAVLAGFSVLELAFPTSPVVLGFFDLFRDYSDPVTLQLGSTLSTSGLAEFCLRALGVIGLYSMESVAVAVASTALVLMSLLTLERSSILALALMAFSVWPSGIFRRIWKQALVLLVLGGVALVLLKGPEAMFGRYLGWMFGDAKSQVAAETIRSTRFRLDLWTWAVDVLHVKPWTGLGLDGFFTRLKYGIPPLADLHPWSAMHSHNFFLEMGVSGGWIALVCSILMFLSFGMLALGPKGGKRNWTALAYCAAQLVSAMVDARIYVSWLAITFFWFPALAWLAGRDLQSRTGNEAEKR